MEHLAVVSGVVRSISGSPGLVGAAEEGDFVGDEFSGGSRGEVAVVGRAIAQLGLVAGNCLRVFFFPRGR